MLGNRSDALYVGEIKARFRPSRVHHFDINPICGERPCKVWDALQNASGPEFHAAACARLGIQLVVDSSKALPWAMDTHRWARRSGMKVHNVLIWKQPRDLAYSYWKRRADPLRWADTFVRYHQRFFDWFPAFHSIEYRDLTEQPRLAVSGVLTASRRRV